MSIEQIQDEVASFLAEECAVHRSELEPERDIFTTGVVDSIKILNLLEFCEKKYGIQISPFDVGPDNFDSIAKISKYVLRNKQV